MSVDEILGILRTRDTEFYSHLSDIGQEGLLKTTSRLAANSAFYVVAEMLDKYPVKEVRKALERYLGK